MTPSIIVDNFFESPTLVRNYALTLPYGRISDGIIPGVRTPFMNILDSKFNDFVIKKALSFLFDLKEHKVNYYVEMMFQQSFGKYQEGWVHHDDPKFDMAGVVYLTPNAPINAGTSLYVLDEFANQNNIDNVQDIKHKFYNDELIDISVVKNNRINHNSCFIKTLDVSNVYNRLFLYNAKTFHKENMFFGNNKDDCRLTLLFFISYMSNNKSPTQRSEFYY